MAQNKSQDKGESEEATVGIESDGRRKEIAVEITPRLKSRGFYYFRQTICTFSSYLIVYSEVRL